MSLRRERERGFTLLELIITVAILVVVSTMAVPIYTSAVRQARIVKAKEELRIIAGAIDLFRARNNYVLPAGLDEVGHGGRLDPWGNQYMYLNFQTGTGSGMEWAVENDLVDPAALPSTEPKTEPASDPTADTTKLTDSITVRVYELAKAGARVLPTLTGGETTRVNSVKRKDRFLFPLNSDYDLFSLGPNKQSAASLGDLSSLDDVIRANDGAYFGLAGDY